MKTRLTLFILFTTLISTQLALAYSNDYLSPQNLIISINKKFDGMPILYDRGTEPILSCQALENPFGQYSSRTTLGDINTQSGDPSALEPGAAFIPWIDNCVESYIGTFLDITIINDKTKDPPTDLNLKSKIRNTWEQSLIVDLFSPFIFGIDTDIRSHTAGNRIDWIVKNRSNFLRDPRNRARLVANLVDWVLGTDEEIQSYGRMTDVDEFRRDLTNSLGENDDLLEATKKVLKILFKRDEFLMN